MPWMRIPSTDDFHAEVDAEVDAGIVIKTVGGRSIIVFDLGQYQKSAREFNHKGRKGKETFGKEMRQPETI